MASLINTEIKPFKATAYHNGKFVPVSSDDLKGKWSVVFFYPADFTFVCPTELGDLADNYASAQDMGVEVYSVSTDTHFTHKAWHDASETIQKIRYPMIGDPTGVISRNFEVMIEEEGLALRGTFVINPEGQIKVAEIHDLGIGRDAKELIRKVQAAQYVAAHPGEVCPARDPGRSHPGALARPGRQDLSFIRILRPPTPVGGRSPDFSAKAPAGMPPGAFSLGFLKERNMLDANIKTQLKAYLERLQRPIELVASLDDSDKSQEMHGLLQDIESLSGRSRCAPTAAPSCAPPSASAPRRDGADKLRGHPDGA